MAEPLQSGCSWEEDPEGHRLAQPGRSDITWLRDGGNPGVRAIFKRPSRTRGLPGEMYSIAMERVIFKLGEPIGLPIPPTYLEALGGEIGCVQLRVENSRAWRHAGTCPMLMNEILNKDDLALGAVFDVWVANHDRCDRNLLAQSDPPDKAPKFAMRCRGIMIDNGCTGLWFPSKFVDVNGSPCTMVEDVAIGGGRMRNDFEMQSRQQMPPDYYRSYTAQPTADRAAIVDRVREISDNDVEEAVGELPEGYMSQRAKDLTVALLKERRRQLDTLCEPPW